MIKNLKEKPPVWEMNTWAELVFQASTLLVIHGYIPQSQHHKVKLKLAKQLGAANV